MSGDQAKISALCREAERLEEDALYSSKGHFNAEDTWGRRNYWLGVPATAFGAIAGAALVKSQPEWASAFTLLASLLTGLMTFHKLSETLQFTGQLPDSSWLFEMKPAFFARSNCLRQIVCTSFLRD
ncbi:SLATT domain-containing protein [Pseudomonas otitidis]|uniref:SLATT domain-containing protein n=1 Tax=Metapseudomonas otitidis TaxID=319939 RepID=UPI002E7C3BFD|nr:SLATT domain-containing protein [Pseudomonas otitidis]MEE1894289.1 SLATT domain-containing protein [Pseudomonas otitidis]